MTFFDKRIYFVACLCICLWLTSCNNNQEYSETLPKTVDFNFHVRPILVQNCYLCHGPDASGRKAGLRLDTFEGATAELEEGGHAIVPGKPSKSLLMYRILHEADDQIMPPPETNYKLTAYEKAILEKWIDQGAQWKDHWAFLPPVNQEKGITDINPIDYFIDAELGNKGLEKAQEASKNTLIRRISYLLTGLPPTPEDVQRFVDDTSDNAYEKMVDSYLDSPTYGERWARHWMDLVRYAETKGHEFDYAITGAWTYRDYLIRAFNDDIPYDQLLMEHLAGDLLEQQRYNKTSGIAESQLGTVFYTMGEGTHSPVDIKQDEADRIDNIIDVTSKTFQGLTVSCAKCHDHKFDPILAADYYSMYGIIQSTRFSPIQTKINPKKLQTVAEIQNIEKYMSQILRDDWSAQDKALVSHVSESPSSVYNSDDVKLIGDFRKADLDGWVSNGLAFGNRTTLGNPKFMGDTGKITRLEKGKASSKMFGTGVFGALRSKNFILDTDFIGVRAQGTRSTIRIIIDNFQLIQNPIYGNLSKTVDNNTWENYIFDIGAWKGHKAYIEILPGEFNSHDYNLPEDAYIEASYAIAYDGSWPLKVGSETRPIKPQNASNLPLQQWSASSRDHIDQKLRQGKLRSHFPELKKLRDSIRGLTETLKDSSFFYGVVDGFAVNSPVFNRGSYKEPSEDSIPRSFLSALPLGGQAFTSEGSGRLELAKAMLNEKNPLTARVMVNRIWHHLFGKGIVETVDNFGLQGKLPSHPKLLDHLAVKFQGEGWSIKKMIRYIVTSDTYKRTTLRNAAMSEKDPNNLLLASFPIRRLEAEAIRDAVLAVSGSLDSTRFGPPVSTHLTDFMQGRGRPKTSGPLDGNGRRSIYLEVRRNFLAPIMTTFDRPIPFSTFGKRDVSNVPSQSLIIMNDPFVEEQAEILAKKVVSLDARSFEDKIAWVYWRSFSRKPTLDELEKANTFFEMLRSAESKTDNETQNETEIWKAYCHSIFNVKEFIYLI